jgi:hypothetical protein
MRKGAFLVEMMGLMGIMVLLTMILVRPMRILTRDIPRQQRDYRANSVISNMLDDLRKDVETANGLMQYKGNAAAGADMLVIDSPDSVISYSFDDNKVTRLCDSQVDIKPSDARRIWDIPGGTFDWKVRDYEGNPVAVEISTGINRRTQSRVKTNLKNSHVLFVDVDTKELQL